MTDQIEPSVTVVIPTLNEEAYIARCLTALKAIDYPAEKLEIRVVDNYSDDQTPRIASRLGARVIEADRKTVAYSRNVGALDVHTDLIAFLDADCLPSAWWMKQAVKHFSSANVAAAGSYPSVLDAESNALQKTWAALCSREDKGVHEVDWLPTANLVVRTTFFKRLGGFNESLATCEDVDLGYRLRSQGIVVYDPRITVYHLREPRTFKEFVEKEAWHAKNNISGFLSHGLRASEIPSLTAPLLFGAGIMAGFIGLVLAKELMTVGFAVSLAIPAAYTVRGYKRTRKVALVFLIYCAYFVARSFAFAREIWVMLFRWHRS
jgi:glycosyltransferase involved in cell wall biosynthesis